MAEHVFTNRLIHETSPYLLQHAHNPVDWHPWDETALNAAKEQNKPIFLSIGYSACHWCHMMEHESFEDPATAKVMNELFINIKVDREERPDLDQIYMTATQLITNHGGWPMSVWLTPDRKPFYAGTYFPPTPRHGMPSFVTVCRHLGQAWKERRDEVLQSADDVATMVVRQGLVQTQAGDLDDSIEKDAARQLARLVDRDHGGLGRAPKFPHSTEMRFLLRAARLTASEDYRHLVEVTLDHMLRGGIYDQLGGGFHRYSTDERWLVPHFEKMLYDNALIPMALWEASQFTPDPKLREEFLEGVDQTLDYVLREMTSPDGPFYSTQDADSEGEEGRYFVWKRQEIMDVLGAELGEVFCYAYDVTDAGNWEEGKNILHLPKPMSHVAKLLSMEEVALKSKLGDARTQLLAIRSRRVAPGRDEKVLTAWNGMMIDAMATIDGGRNGRFAKAASRAADFLLDHMRAADGRLFRTYKDGRARLNAYLEDYAYLANGLVSLYEATFDPRYVTHAIDVIEHMVEEFWDEKDGGFFYTGKRHESLIARGKDPHDGAIPSGNAMAATAMARIAGLTGNSALLDMTERTLQLFRSVMTNSPTAAAQMMIALELHRGPTTEVAIVGDPADDQTAQILGLLRERFVPNKVIALRRPGQSDEQIRPVSLLEGKTSLGEGPTIYICRDFACQASLVGLAQFRDEWDRLAPLPAGS